MDRYDIFNTFQNELVISEQNPVIKWMETFEYKESNSPSINKPYGVVIYTCKDGITRTFW